MADNVTLNAGSGGASLATDDIVGVHYQRVKVTYGVDGSATDVSDSNPLPIDDAGGSITVDGTVTANLSATDNAVLDNIDTQTAAAQTALEIIDNAVAAEGAALGSGVLLQGDDGTDRKNINVDATTGDVQVDVTNTVTVDATSSGDVPITLAGETVTVTGTVTSVGAAAENAAASGNPVLVAGRYDLTPRTLGDGDAGAIALDADGAVQVSDGGNSLTVDGTVTANLSATDNAVLDAIAASVAGTLTVDGSGVTQPVSAASLPLPSGAATAANQSTIIGHVDGIETTLTSIETSVQTLDNAISGSEMQVDVVASLPAGTNVVGDVGISGARTSGGTTPYRNIDVDETEDAVKASAGQVYWIHAMNLTAAVLYLHLYNATVASVTVGTTTPTLTFPIGTTGDTNGAGFTFSVPNGIAFGTAITVACTTTVGGSSGPAANGCIVNMGYA